jgi:hypothetical protein
VTATAKLLRLYTLYELCVERCPFSRLWHNLYTHCSVVIEERCYKLEGRRFNSLWGHWIFSFYLILPAALGAGVYSASNRNEYRKSKEMFLGSKARPCVRLTTSLPSVSLLSRYCGVLNISKPYKPPRPFTRVALLHFILSQAGDLYFITCKRKWSYSIRHSRASQWSRPGDLAEWELFSFD